MRGWCLEVHDLAVAKYVAGPETDRDVTRALVRHAVIRRDILEGRLRTTILDDIRRKLVQDRIAADFAA